MACDGSSQPLFPLVEYLEVHLHTRKDDNNKVSLDALNRSTFMLKLFLDDILLLVTSPLSSSCLEFLVGYKCLPRVWSDFYVT